MFKKLSIKLKRNHPTLQYRFLILLFKNTEKKIGKSRADAISRLKNYCKQKNTGVIAKENLMENRLV